MNCLVVERCYTNELCLVLPVCMLYNHFREGKHLPHSLLQILQMNMIYPQATGFEPDCVNRKCSMRQYHPHL